MRYKRTAIKSLSERDPLLGNTIKAAGPCTIEASERPNLYASLVRNVMFQQLHGNAARAIFSRFLNLYPKRKFPKPEEIIKTRDKKLRSVGVSASKILSIKAIAQGKIDGVIPTGAKSKKLSDEELIERLTTIRGIGEWTVHMLLMFELGRIDVLPTGDYGVRNGASIVYGMKELPTPKQLAELGEKWRPYRTVAAYYLWRAVDLKK